jgi:hypothetical protein
MRILWLISLLLFILPAHAGPYKSIEVTSPENDVTFFPYQTDINIEFKSVPGLDTGKKHVAIIMVNGEIADRGNVTSHTLHRPNRGTYHVSAQIRDARGKVLIRSKEIIFHVKRHHR